MRFDLTTPCTNCPFRSDATRITFKSKDRAQQIEEQAYRHGFPCHVSAELHENQLTHEEGYVFGEQTQYCAGHILMQLHESTGSPWPGIGNDEELVEQLAEQMDWNAPVFENADDFIAANRAHKRKRDRPPSRETATAPRTEPDHAEP